MLHTDRLVERFKRRTLVCGASIELRPGEIVGLLGPNGAGKTTTFGMIVGLLRPTSGAVWFDGRDVTRMPMYRRAQAGVSYLPQESSVFRNLTVRQNLLAVLERRNGMSEGVILASGPPKGIAGDAAVRKRYLGEKFKATFRA